MVDSHLVVGAVSDLRRGGKDSRSGDGGALPFSVLEQEVGTELLPCDVSRAADIHLDTENELHQHLENLS